jgi:hypothetical protein
MALHGNDLSADGELAAKLFLQIRRGGKMIGMRMSFQQPVDGEIFLADVVDDPIRPARRGPPRSRVEIQHAIDHRRMAGFRVMDDIADGESRLVEKSLDRHCAGERVRDNSGGALQGGV